MKSEEDRQKMDDKVSKLASLVDEYIVSRRSMSLFIRLHPLESLPSSRQEDRIRKQMTDSHPVITCKKRCLTHFYLSP